MIFNIFLKFIFGCSGFLLLCMAFSGCGEWGLLSSRGTRVSHCGDSSCCRAQALGHTGFSSCAGGLSCGCRTLICSVAQSSLTLYNSVDCSPPGSSVCGIFQASILEQVSISYSGGPSPSRD